ncbi:unnamed protein product [Sphagnum troendelagicum]
MAMRQRLALESRCSGLIASCGHIALVSSWSGHDGKVASGHTEKVWREFFSDPSQWWDCRPEKVNTRYPDFKHKKTQDALWLGGRRNPPWVAAGVAAMAPGTVQMDSFSWNRRLAKYVKAGEYEKTMELFKQMQKRGMRPDRFTFVPVLNACAGLRALEEGRRAHQLIMQTGCEADVFVGNVFVRSSLIDMYAKCGSMEEASRVFNKLPSWAAVCWNAMIFGHVKCGEGHKALQLFQKMQHEDVFVRNSLIDMYAKCGSMEEASRVFNKLPSWAAVCWNAMIFGHVKCGEGHKALQLFQKMQHEDVFVRNSLVDMYAKCGSMEDACRVFNTMPSHDVVSWNALLGGFAMHGQGKEALKALELFRQMQQEGVQPNYVTFVGVLNACASVIALEEGRHVHQQIIQSGLESDVFVGSSLVDMYAKCGRIEDAWKVFHKMPSRDVVTWNAVVLGHVKCGHEQKALELFQQMQQEGVRPNSVTFVGVLNACASVIALEEGRHVHQQIIQSGLESDVFVGSSLVDMYAKCGSIEDACRVFNKMPSRDVVTWTAILGGCAMHGHGREALKHFEQMCDEGVQPDDITFVCVLSACSHAGLVDEGMCLYASMIRDYMIPAKLEHYTCMVDLLSRAGHLQEAENMIMAMPCKPQAAAWMALLGACRIHGNVGMAERVAKRILEMEPENAAVYVLLSNIYAAAGNRHLCENVEWQRKERGAKKQPGCTWIEVNNEVHMFVVQDQDHPQMIEIHAELQRLSGLMHNAGYVPCTELVLDDVEEEEKVSHLCHHSEKLAIAFGLINRAPGTPLQIRKNLWVCKDCHTSAKFISKIVRRAIMVRDANRFHHFEDGVCSCMDYW